MVADKCEYAIMSMVLEDGSPYCIPLSIARDGDFIYFHCAYEGQKIDALKSHPSVCLSCVGDTRRAEDEFTTEYESAVIFGTAQRVEEEKEKIHALRLIRERHTPKNMKNFDKAIGTSLNRTDIWRTSIRHITGKGEKNQPLTRRYAARTVRKGSVRAKPPVWTEIWKRCYFFSSFSAFFPSERDFQYSSV